MDIGQAKKYIGKIDWYKQAAAIKPLYISYPFYACSEMRVFGRKIRLRYEIVVHFGNDYMDDYISEVSLEKVAKYYYARQDKDEEFISNLLVDWHKRCVAPYKKMLEFILAEDISKYDEEGLKRIFKRFTDFYLKVWSGAIFLDGFDHYGDRILGQILKKENKNIASGDLEILTAPPSPSFLQKERMSLLKIAEKIGNKKKFFVKLEHSEAVKKYPWLEKDMISHSQHYYWLNNDFSSVEYLEPKHFYSKLKLLLRNTNALKKEKEMKKFLGGLEEKKRMIYQKYGISSKTKNLIDFLALLGNFRDERKTYNQMAGNVLYKFAEEFSRRTGLRMDLIENLFFWELDDAFGMKNKAESIRKAKSRKKGVFYLVTSSRTFIEFIGRESEELNEYVKKMISKDKDLRGMPAYAGIVRGTVKIIKNKDDFHKLKRGEILVAPNTRPEYVPIMKIASAIISEEGGITCHSAITSREFKIPCVVGVQGVISILKDGDVVEVDAENGIVKILK